MRWTSPTQSLLPWKDILWWAVELGDVPGSFPGVQESPPFEQCHQQTTQTEGSVRLPLSDHPSVRVKGED